MKSTLEMVREFHDTFGVDHATHQNEHKIRPLRARLIREEFRELSDALAFLDPVETLDALCDLLYVTDGALLAFNMNGYVESDLTNGLPTAQYSLGQIQQASKTAAWTLERGYHKAIQQALSNLAFSIHEFNRHWGFLKDGHKLTFSEVFPQAFQEVHRSNMSKLDENGKPVLREDGKILKSNLFSPPNLRQFVEGGDQ